MVVGAKRLINCATNYTDDVYFTFKKIIFFPLDKATACLKAVEVEGGENAQLEKQPSGRASD